MAHRVGALVTLLYVGWLACIPYASGSRDHLCATACWCLVLLLAQVTLGIINVSRTCRWPSLWHTMPWRAANAESDYT